MVDSDGSVGIVVEINSAAGETLTFMIGVVKKFWWIVMMTLWVPLMIFRCDKRHDKMIFENVSQRRNY